MDRNTVVRWVFFSAIIFVLWKWVLPGVTGKHGEPQASKLPAESYVNAPGFPADPIDANSAAAGPSAPAVACAIKGNRFDAELTTHGAALTHLHLRDPQYAGTNGFDMSTTPDIERWHSLRTLFRQNGVASEGDQVKFDRFEWTLGPRADEKSCTFTYVDDQVSLVKTVRAGDQPFELDVETTLTNLSDSARHHRFAIGTYAFRRNSEVKGHLGRVSPFQTELLCAREGQTTRKGKDDFKEGWFSEPLVDHFVAVSNYYFAQALIPEAGEKPECRLLAEDWVAEGQDRDADEAGDVYHGELVYPVRELAAHASTTYRQTAFFGPKERDVLARAAGGRAHLSDVINLGIFSPVAKVLVGALVFFHAHVAFGNWGLSIIALTLSLKIVLFPLTWKSIKTTVGMRKLKPELDDIAKKFPDDAQARQMATMELYRKNGVNVLGGCLPQLVQMPVWFAMYTTLQTAVEMYHEKFLWFADLSAPDKFYVLPIVLGGFMILQQHIVPQQGMDPMQQKMMMYLMPGVFTVMMLFLPVALGVYMLTNSVLGIVQQLAVERLAPRSPPGAIVVKQGANDRTFGKGNARV